MSRRGLSGSPSQHVGQELGTVQECSGGEMTLSFRKALLHVLTRST